MVYKIIGTKYWVFVEALVFTVLIFIIGFSLAMFIEFNRINTISQDYKNYEIETLDLKLQNYYFQIMDSSSCKQAIEQNFQFADDIYLKGLKLEQYEEANQLTDDLKIEKKRYVLLKTELWLNSLLLKEKCKDPFDTIVYLYSGDPSNNIAVAQQKVISNVLKDVKDDKGNSVILIPIAGDLELKSVELQMNVYNITSLPAILINEKKVIYGYSNAKDIEKYLK